MKVVVLSACLVLASCGPATYEEKVHEIDSLVEDYKLAFSEDGFESENKIYKNIDKLAKFSEIRCHDTYFADVYYSGLKHFMFMETYLREKNYVESLSESYVAEYANGISNTKRIIEHYDYCSSAKDYKHQIKNANINKWKEYPDYILDINNKNISEIRKI